MSNESVAKFHRITWSTRAPVIVLLVSALGLVFAEQCLEVIYAMASEWQSAARAQQAWSSLVGLYFLAGCGALSIRYIAANTLSDNDQRSWIFIALVSIVPALPIIAATVAIIVFWSHASTLVDKTAAESLETSILVLIASGALYALISILMRNFRPYYLMLFQVACLTIAAAVAWIFVDAIKHAQMVGPLAIYCLFFAMISCIIAIFSVLSIKTGFPVITCLFIWAVTIGYFDLNDNHVVQTRPHKAAIKFAEDYTHNWKSKLTSNANTELIESFGSLKAAQDLVHRFGLNGYWTHRGSIKGTFERWLESRADLLDYAAPTDVPIAARKRYPVYLIAAPGGGHYAAMQTAQVLSALQDACPNFAQHIFAISSVSGGSLGAAVFTALAAKYAKNERAAACDPNRASSISFTDTSKRILSHDFLSPLLSYFFFPDFLQRFVPVAIESWDRARGLEAAFERAWEQVVPSDGEGNLDKAGLKGSLFDYYDYKGAAPALFSNTTIVEMGSRLIASPLLINNGFPEPIPLKTVEFSHIAPGLDLKWSTAASISARFPWVTPPATVPVLKDRLLDYDKIRVADGGYYENSGLATLSDIRRVIVNELSSVGARKFALSGVHPSQIDVRVIVLGSTPTEIYEVRSSGSAALGESLSPMKTMLSTRSARAIEYWADQNRRCTTDFALSDTRFRPVLGWFLSRRTVDEIAQKSDWRKLVKEQSWNTEDPTSLSYDGPCPSLKWPTTKEINILDMGGRIRQLRSVSAAGVSCRAFQVITQQLSTVPFVGRQQKQHRQDCAPHKLEAVQEQQPPTGAATIGGARPRRLIKGDPPSSIAPSSPSLQFSAPGERKN